MIWFRNIFADTLSTNNGALTVEDLGLTNRITFRPSANSIEYKLYGRRIGGSWVEIDVMIDGSLGNDLQFEDTFDWIDDTGDPINIEYKVEVTKTIPVTPEGYYITNF